MKTPIKPLSRQRRWQLATIEAGLCKICAAPRAAGDPTFCRAHREAKRESQREYMRRRRGTISA